MHFYRACSRHRDELEEDGELLRCPQGHIADEWLVMSEDGTIISRAFADKNGVYVGEEATDSLEKNVRKARPSLEHDVPTNRKQKGI